MTAKELKEAPANVPDDDLKYISLLLLIPEILSGRITKEELLDEMVKLGLTEEEKNELLKRVEDEFEYETEH